MPKTTFTAAETAPRAPGNRHPWEGQQEWEAQGKVSLSGVSCCWSHPHLFVLIQNLVWALCPRVSPGTEGSRAFLLGFGMDKKLKLILSGLWLTRTQMRARLLQQLCCHQPQLHHQPPCLAPSSKAHSVSNWGEKYKLIQLSHPVTSENRPFLTFV